MCFIISALVLNEIDNIKDKKYVTIMIENLQMI